MSHPQPSFYMGQHFTSNMEHLIIIGRIRPLEHLVMFYSTFYSSRQQIPIWLNGKKAGCSTQYLDHNIRKPRATQQIQALLLAVCLQAILYGPFQEGKKPLKLQFRDRSFLF